MVSDRELAAKLHELLQSSDLKKTTNNILINNLESHFGVDLSHKKPFIRHQVDIFLQQQYHFSEELQIHSSSTTPPLGFTPLNDGVFDDDDGDGDGDGDDDDDDDGCYVGDGTTTGSCDNNNNGSFSNKGIIKLQRPRKEHKMKNKRVCESGKFCTLSPELQKFLGVPHMTRAQVVKRLWSYVKDKNLQSPQDGKTINCDETLRGLFGVDSINILQINKALTKHILPSAKSMRREKPRKHEREPDEAELNAKQPRKVYSGFLAPLPLSESLVKFLGTGESALTRGDVIKRLWGYIKDKNLQDPCDKKTVICDEKLKELFNVDSFNGFMVSKLLTAHFVKL